MAMLCFKLYLAICACMIVTVTVLPTSLEAAPVASVSTSTSAHAQASDHEGAPPWLSEYDEHEHEHEHEHDDGMRCGTHGDLDAEGLAESEREFNAFRAWKEQQSLASRAPVELSELNIDVIFYARKGRVTPQRKSRGSTCHRIDSCLPPPPLKPRAD